MKDHYLDNLDTLLHILSLGNSGRVAERMIFSLLRIFISFSDEYEGLIDFPAIVLDRGPPLLHGFDGLSDQYLSRRIKAQRHDTAVAELGGDDNLDWVSPSCLQL